MKRLRLSILWHMHQPYYKDDADGLYHMPWVYLHAIKDYHEMAAHIEKAAAGGKVKATFNYVPSLLMQLKDYESANVNDTFMILLRKDTAALNDAEKRTLLRQLIMLQPGTMAGEFRRMGDLLAKVKEGYPLLEQEIRDMSVLYLLAWTGTFLRSEEIPTTLIKKGRGFTEAEKAALLNFHTEKVASVIPLYKKTYGGRCGRDLHHTGVSSHPSAVGRFFQRPGSNARCPNA